MSSKPKTVETTSQTTAQIPAFLQPYLTQAAQASGRGLGDLEAMTGDIISSMPGAGELNSQAAGQIMDYLGGTDANRDLALQKFGGIAGGRALRDTAGQFNALQGDPNRLIAQAGTVNQGSQDVLNNMMQGNFIGSEGFNANVDASIRAAQPYIFSGFGKSGGVGAVKGGLAQVAMQQAASDAFAGLYGDERNRQFGAANAMEQAEIARQQVAVQQQMADAARESNRISERGMLGNIGMDERTNQMNAAGVLLGNGQQTALTNAAALQGLASVPYNAQNSLFQNAVSGIPGSLIGQTTTGSQPYTKNTAGGILGGALTGAQIGSAVPFIGTGLGAIGGGLLGAFG